MNNGTRQPAIYGESIEVRAPRAERAGRNKSLAIVQLISDDIICNLFARSFDGAENSVTYELVLSNRSGVGILCRLYGLDTTAHTREFGMLSVAKHAAGSSFFSVPLETGERRRMFVEVLGDGISLFAEAMQPTAPIKWRAPKVVVTALLAVAIIASIVGTVMGRPSLEALSINRGSDLPTVTGARSTAEFAVPEHLIAGQPFAVTIGQPKAGRHVVLRDEMHAVVADVTLRPNVNHVTFVPPASPTTETYYLTSTSPDNAAHVQTQTLRVDPR